MVDMLFPNSFLSEGLRTVQVIYDQVYKVEASSIYITFKRGSNCLLHHFSGGDIVNIPNSGAGLKSPYDLHIKSYSG